MKFVILEDDIRIGNKIAEIIKTFYDGTKEKYTICFYHKGEEVCENITKDNVDCYFLDIELADSNMNGYQVAKFIRQKNKNTNIILLSSHTEYACDAYEIDVLRFLKKPIEEKKVCQALSALKKRTHEQQNIIINVGRHKRRVALNKILYIEKQLRKARIYLITGEEIYFYCTIEELNKMFGMEPFVQIQRSFFISMDYIKKMQKGKVVLETGEDINIGRSYQKEVFMRFMKFMENRVNI